MGTTSKGYLVIKHGTRMTKKDKDGKQELVPCLFSYRGQKPKPKKLFSEKIAISSEDK